MNSSPQPTTEKVVSALKRYRSAPKTTGTLCRIVPISGSEEAQTCFCVEGVFCAVAAELGFGGEFVNSRDSIGLNASFKITTFEQTRTFNWEGSKFAATPPVELFDFLGLPRVLTRDQIVSAGLGKVFTDAHSKGYWENHWKEYNATAWHNLNDYSPATLDELIQFACDLLKPPTK
jgi:hypothetical protein